MKNQASFSSKDKNKKIKCRLLQFLFASLRVKEWSRLCMLGKIQLYLKTRDINTVKVHVRCTM